MENLEVTITLTFGENDAVDIKGGNVPPSLILERLKNVTHALSRIIIKDAREDMDTESISADDLGEYLDAVIAVDRVKLEELLK